MGTNERTLTTLDTVFFEPLRYVNTDVSFFVLGGACRPGTIIWHLGYFNLIAFSFNHLGGNISNEVRRRFRNGWRHLMAVGGFKKFDFDYVLHSSVNGFVVHVDNFVAFLAIGLLDGILDGSNCLFLGDNSGDKEEGSLHDHIDTGTKTKGYTKRQCIDDVELCFFVDQVFLDTPRQLFPDLFGVESSGEEECSTFIKITKHVVLIKEGEVMTGNEVGLIN